METMTTAIHESGHAVAHVRLEIDQGQAAIKPNDEKGTAGGVAASDLICSEKDVEDQLLSLCAGYAALIATGHDETTARCGADSDFDKATDLIDTFGFGSLDDWLSKSVDLMRWPENLRAVERVAQELVKRETLDFEEIDILLEIADGKTTEAEYEEYRSRREYFGARQR